MSAGREAGGGGRSGPPPSGDGKPSERALKARAKVRAGPTAARRLKVKVSSVKRLEKELTRYREEVDSERAKLERMRADGKDEYDISKQAEVLGESEMMIPDTERRLEAAINDLEEFIGSEGGNPEVSGSEDFAEARRIIESFTSAAAAEDGGDDIGEDEM